MFFTIELLIRSTVLLTICLLFIFALKRASASLKHWMMSLTILLLLILPIVHFTLPKWGIEFKKIETINQFISPKKSTEAKLSHIPSIHEGEVHIFSETNISSPTPLTSFSKVSEKQDLLKSEWAPTAIRMKATSSNSIWKIDWEITILAVWLIGFIYFSAKMVWGLYQIRFITLKAIPAALPVSFLSQFASLNLPPILHSHAISTPMTWGFWRPVILLPKQAKSWTHEEMRTVILHEYAHIKRGDYLIHLISLFVRNLYWFHPFVWILNSIQLVEREKACDEYVLNMGLKPTDYAAQLVAFAKKISSSSAMRHLPGLTFARPSQIKKRTLAILSYKKVTQKALITQRWIMGIVLSAFFLCAANMKPVLKAPELGSVSISPSIQEIISQHTTLLSSIPIDIPAQLSVRIPEQAPQHRLTENQKTEIDAVNEVKLSKIEQGSLKWASTVASSSPKLPSSFATFQSPLQKAPSVSIPKGRLKKMLKKNFAFIESGQAYVDSQMVDVESFYIFKQEIANIDWQEFLADLKRQNDMETLAIAQIDSAMWSTLRYFKGAYHVVVKGDPKPEGGEKRFAEHFLDPITKSYHNHPAFWNYPIVNINYQAAQLYCKWLTQKYREIYGSDFPEGAYFRLPSKREWVRAARGDSKSHYPWRGYHLKNKKGKYLANFKSMISAESIHYNQESQEYEVINATTNVQDGYMITSPVKSYPQNTAGMYNLIGNVAEMLDQEGMSIGGSWNSTGFDVRVESIFQYEGSSPMVGLRPMLVWP